MRKPEMLAASLECWRHNQVRKKTPPPGSGFAPQKCPGIPETKSPVNTGLAGLFVGPCEIA